MAAQATLPGIRSVKELIDEYSQIAGKLMLNIEDLEVLTVLDAEAQSYGEDPQAEDLRVKIWETKNLKPLYND